MKIHRSIKDLREGLRAWRAADERIGFVPTMGFLHEGHMSLVRRAQSGAKRVVVSIFVNPTQFGQAGDLEAYPRDEARDLALLEAEGVDAVFLPQAGEIYPQGDETIVETTRLANILHGQVRPGHFRGVTSVVARLFNIVQPDMAVFGEKDYQQLQVIRRMVRDLHMPVEILGAPTVREADGLAMSSRNVRLCPEDRAAAVVLSQALSAGEAVAAKGAGVEAIRAAIAAKIEAEPRATLTGLDAVHHSDLTEMSGPLSAPLAVMISAQFSDILLIDQRVIQP